MRGSIGYDPEWQAQDQAAAAPAEAPAVKASKARAAKPKSAAPKPAAKKAAEADRRQGRGRRRAPGRRAQDRQAALAAQSLDMSGYDEGEIEGSRAPLLDHLIELRKRLITCVAAVAVAFAVCFGPSRANSTRSCCTPMRSAPA